MENEQIKLEVKTSGDTLTILHGRAPEPINPRAVSVSGNHNAVMEYVTAKPLSEKIKNHDTFIVIDNSRQKIELTVDESLPSKTTVDGELKKSDDFAKWGIETEKRYTVNQLKQMVRVNRMFFPNRDQHTELLSSLGRVELEVSKIVKESDDDRGNIVNNIEQRVNSSIKESFTLMVPIYGGVAPAKFEVSIRFEVRDRNISIWLESPEAMEIARDYWDRISAEQLAKFTQMGFAVIVRN